MAAATGFFGSSGMSLLQPPRVIYTTPKTPVAPTPPVNRIPVSRIPAPTGPVIGDPIIKVPPFVPPILVAGGGMGDAPPPPPPDTPTGTAGTGAGGGSTGTPDTGIDRLVNQLGTLFQETPVAGGTMPVQFAPEGETNVTPTDSAPSKAPLFIMLFILGAGIIYYLKKRGKK